MLSFFALIKRLPLTRAIFYGMLILLAAVLIQRCDHRKVKEITSEELKEGERTAVIIDGNSVTVVAAPNGRKPGDRIRPSLLRGRKSQPETVLGKVVERIEGARGVRVSVGDDGKVSVTSRTRGLCFEPGIGSYVTSGNRRLFIDAQFLFSRRNGLNAGLGIGLQRPIDAAGFIAYSYNFYSNTSVLVGYDTDSKVLIGLRVKF